MRIFYIHIPKAYSTSICEGACKETPYFSLHMVTKPEFYYSSCHNKCVLSSITRTEALAPEYDDLNHMRECPYLCGFNYLYSLLVELVYN